MCLIENTWLNMDDDMTQLNWLNMKKSTWTEHDLTWPMHAKIENPNNQNDFSVVLLGIF